MTISQCSAVFSGDSARTFATVLSLCGLLLGCGAETAVTPTLNLGQDVVAADAADDDAGADATEDTSPADDSDAGDLDVGDSGLETSDGGADPCESVSDCPPSTSACRAPVCLPDGVCGEANQPAALSCDDGDPCTLDDACDGAGVCASGAAKDCDDGVPCTMDGCAAGVCTHDADDAVCSDG